MSKPWPVPSEDNRSEKLKILAELLQARMTFDYDRICSYLADDAICRVVGDRRICPFAGSFVGEPQIREAMRLLDAQFEFLDLDDRVYLVDGDLVAVRWTSLWRNRGSSNSAKIEGFAYFQFEGRFVSEYTTFIDTASVQRLAG